MKFVWAIILILVISVGLSTKRLSPSVTNLNPAPTTQPFLSSTPKATLPPLPNAKTLKGGTQVFQTFNNCGPAALSMALSHYEISISQQELGKKLRPYQHSRGDNDDKSVTLKELAEIAREYGLIPYYRPAGNIDLIQQFIATNIPIITRTLLKEGEDIGHYRVVKGFDELTETIIQDDSLQGANLSYSYNNFLNLWQAFNFEYLVLVPPEKSAQAAAILKDYFNEQTAWEYALKTATESTIKNPDDIYARFNQVVALYYLNDFQQAIEIFESIESVLPARTLWYQIEPILTYQKVGNNDRVIALTTQILNNDNLAFSELYELRGQIFQQQGDHQAADREYALARRYNSTDIWRVNLP